jgi:inosose dehydratase
MFDEARTVVSRRGFLQSAVVAATVGATLRAPTVTSGADTAADAYAGLKMGLQSYSLRNFTVAEAMKHTKSLGLGFWEGFPGHVPMGSVPKHITEQRELLKQGGITMLSYGVLPFDTDETKARGYFEFAKGMGLTALSADPAKDKATFDLLDKLVEEYGVAIAIHNHGPGHRYDKISDVVEMVKDRHPKIGACVDTGHYLRSDEDPVAAIEQLGTRVFGVHLKDVRTISSGGERKKQFTICGEGDLNIFGCLKALKQLRYQALVALEYEENPDNPLSDLEVSLQHVRAAAAKLA